MSNLLVVNVTPHLLFKVGVAEEQHEEARVIMKVGEQGKERDMTYTNMTDAASRVARALMEKEAAGATTP